MHSIKYTTVVIQKQRIKYSCRYTVNSANQISDVRVGVSAFFV